MLENSLRLFYLSMIPLPDTSAVISAVCVLHVKSSVEGMHSPHTTSQLLCLAGLPSLAILVHQRTLKASPTRCTVSSKSMHSLRGQLGGVKIRTNLITCTSEDRSMKIGAKLVVYAPHKQFIGSRAHLIVCSWNNRSGHGSLATY